MLNHSESLETEKDNFFIFPQWLKIVRIPSTGPEYQAIIPNNMHLNHPPSPCLAKEIWNPSILSNDEGMPTY